VHFAFAIFFEVKKKDFFEVSISQRSAAPARSRPCGLIRSPLLLRLAEQLLGHHVCTIVLIAFSYHVNFVRIGSLVILVHDLADPFLELGKLLNYAKRQAACDAVFTIFAVDFGITRIFMYPRSVIYSALFESRKFLPEFSGYYVFNGLLILLVTLRDDRDVGAPLLTRAFRCSTFSTCIGSTSSCVSCTALRFWDFPRATSAPRPRRAKPRLLRARQSPRAAPMMNQTPRLSRGVAARCRMRTSALLSPLFAQCTLLFCERALLQRALRPTFGRLIASRLPMRRGDPEGAALRPLPLKLLARSREVSILT
jgi:hypothetical protein